MPEKFVTKCRLKKSDGIPCGHTIVDFALTNQQLAERDSRTQTFIAALIKHLTKKHPQAWDTIQRESQFFTGFLLFGLFETEDPSVRETVVSFGAHLRNITRMPPITDQRLEEATAQLGFTMDDPQRAAVLQILQALRNHYEGTLTVQPAHQEKTLVSQP